MRSHRWIVAYFVTLGCTSAAPRPSAPDDDAAPADVSLDVRAPDGMVVVDAPVARDGGADVIDVAPVDATPDVTLVDGAPDAARDAAPDVAVTTLRVRYAARDGAIALRGSLAPLDWDHGAQLRRVAADTWEWTSTDLRAPLEWKPLLDDATWSRGPNYRAQPGTTVVVFPHFLSGVGEYARTYPNFASTVLGNRRGVWVYLPPSYAENTAARFPVVYMHDGQNLFDPRAAFGGVVWNAHRAMNDGAESGAIREAILVGVENTAARIAEYTPTADAMYGGGNGDAYLRMLVDEVKPLIDREYRTLPDRANTALVGSSLGGLISSYAGVRRADVFGLVGALSPSTWWNDRVLLREVATTPMRAARPLRVYVDSGDGGASRDGVDDTRELAATYTRVGYVEGTTLRYVVQPGGQHNETYWAMRLPGALAFLLGPRDP